jgi:putative transposase
VTGTVRSKHYYKPKKYKLKDAFILDKIVGIALNFPSYGYRRITAHLRREGIIINHKKVYRIMRDNSICCSIRRAYKHTTNSNHGLVKYPNLVKNLVPSKLNEVWHADITYIRFASSFAYLAAIIDGLSRKAIGYAIGKTLSPALTISALKVAMGKRNTDGLIHHLRSGISVLLSTVCKDFKGKRHRNIHVRKGKSL